MNAAARQGVEIGRQGRDERLTFTRSHLGDAALVQGDAADHLHVKVPHAGDAARRLANGRESLGQELVQDLLLGLAPLVLVLDALETFGDDLFEFRRLGLQLLVRHRLSICGSRCVDLRDDRLDASLKRRRSTSQKFS